MDEAKKEAKKAVWSFGGIGRRLSAWSKAKASPRHPKAEPWVRIREKRGEKVLEWGVGDGQRFGIVPLGAMGAEVTFHGGDSGVKILAPGKPPVVIGIQPPDEMAGNREDETVNRALARKIEASLRGRGAWGSSFRILLGGAGILVLLFTTVWIASGGRPGGNILADGTGGKAGGKSFPGLSDLPSSMSSGLTCHTH